MIRYLPVQNERLYEQIAEQIESRIISGDLKVGDQLPPERELAEQFKVSRTAVREAIKTLREKGLIEIRTGRGTFITNGTAGVMRQSMGLLLKFGSNDDYGNLVEVREIMEPEIAAMAATRMTDEYILAMQEAYDVMKRSDDNSALYIEGELDFHMALAEATHNPLIPAMMESIIDLLREERNKTAKAKGGLKRGQVYHRRILDAVLLHDPQAARLAMKEHLAQLRVDMKTSTQPTD
jgi:GntR family transcriptional repressor for pyruvate dehydrogenase complex